MNWTTTIVSASAIGEDGDATVVAQTVLTFKSWDLWHDIPGFDRISDIIGESIENIFTHGRWIEFISYLPLLEDISNPEMASPDRTVDARSWGRVFWTTPIEVNADTQEQVDSLIGLVDEGMDWKMPPF